MMKIEIKEIKRYMEENPNYTITAMAEHFKISRPTMRKYLYELNLKGKTEENPKLEEKELREFIIKNPNLTQKQIAEYFNVSTSTMNRCIRRFGINKTDMRIKKSRLSKEELETYIKNNPSATLKQTSEDLGISISSLIITLDKYGIKRKNKTSGRRKTKKAPENNEKIMLKVIELRRNKPDISLSKILDFLKGKGIVLTEKEVLDYEKNMDRKNNDDIER